MFDFHEKRKIKSWLFSKPTIILLLAASVFLASSVYERYQKERETAEKHAERAAELATLETHAAALEEEVKYIQSARGIEEEIRDRFDVVKQGERAAIIMDEVARPAATTTAPVSVLPQEVSDAGFFSKLFFWR